MHVTLTPDQEKMVRSLVESGSYANENDVVAEALRRMEEDDGLEPLRAAVQVGLAEIERGEVVEYTPALREEMIRWAIQAAKDGREPDPDVLP